MKIRVCVYANQRAMSGGIPLKSYIMDHDDQEQRRVLGMQCRFAFEAGQCITTAPIPSKTSSNKS